MRQPIINTISNQCLYTASHIEALVSDVASQVEEGMSINYKYGAPIFVILLNGGAYFGVDLTRTITLPHQVEFVHIHKHGPQSSKLVFGKQIDLRGRYVIIVDEFIDSGETLEVVASILYKNGAIKVAAATLLVRDIKKLDAIIERANIDTVFVGDAVQTDEWLFGYGLNHDDGTGHDNRSLKEIYAIKKKN